MAAPAYQATGTPQAGGAQALTVPWPAHAVDDIAILVMEGVTAPGLGTANGFVRVADAPQVSTSVPSALDVYWCRATSTSMASPVTNAFSNHGYAVILTFRGCVTTGNPWDVTSGGINDTADGALSATGDTTTVADCLVVFVAGRGSDFATDVYSAESAANLTSLTEQHDAGTAIGNGGGVGVWHGLRSTAGAYGPLTANIAGTSVSDAFISIAFKPPSAAATGTVAVTQAAQTSTASALETFTATSAQTQAAQTSTASGSVANPVTGTVAQTQANQTSAASGLETITGTSANVQANQTSTASGSVGAAPITGIVAVTQANQTSTASGFSVQNLTGTVAVTQAAQTSTASAVETFTGTSANVQDDQTSTATATFGYAGTVNVTQDNQTSTASGIAAVAITGTLAEIQDDQFSTATANGGTVTFWAPQPAGYTYAPVSHTKAPVGFVRVGAGSVPPPW